MVGFWLLALLFLALITAGPWWPYSRGWGYTPAAAVLGALAIWALVVWLGWVSFLLPWASAVPPVG